MSSPRRHLLTLLAACAIPFLSACPSSPAPEHTSTQPGSVPQTIPVTQPTQNPTCDCSIFPPKAGCDSQCGITTGVVEQVTADSVTISVPEIKLTPSGERTTQITQRTFAISPAESKQLQAVKGSRVALTFHQQSGQNVMKSIRKIPVEPAK